MIQVNGRRLRTGRVATVFGALLGLGMLGVFELGHELGEQGCAAHEMEIARLRAELAQVEAERDALATPTRLNWPLFSSDAAPPSTASFIELEESPLGSPALSPEQRAFLLSGVEVPCVRLIPAAEGQGVSLKPELLREPLMLDEVERLIEEARERLDEE